MYFYGAFFVILEPSVPISPFTFLLYWKERSGYSSKDIFCVPRKKESWLNNDIFEFNFPTGICKVPLSISAPLFVLVSVWEVDCVFRHTHAYTHTLGVFMLVYETKLCLYVQDPSYSVSFGTNPLPSLPCISIFLSLTHTPHPVSVFSNKRDCL